MKQTILIAVGIAMVATLEIGGQSSGQLPPRLADFVTRHVKLTAAQQTALRQGEPVTAMLDGDPSREVSVFGAVWIDAPAARYVEAVRNIEQFEKGGAFRVTKRISSPPRLEDFDQLTLTEDDFRDLKTCKVESCELKLGEVALTRLQKGIDWTSPDARQQVNQAMRKFGLDYVTGYLEGGNERLAVYRDSKRPTFVAKEFTSMIDRMPSLTEYLPDLKKYLLEFPKSTMPNSESMIYWQEAKFGLKPTVRINHLTIVQEPTHVAVVSKMLYASHYFWTAIELRVLVPDPSRGPGFWFVNVTRSRSDGLSGFMGSMIRGKVRGEAEKGMQNALGATKATLERK